jgi:hypothetical protein
MKNKTHIYVALFVVALSIVAMASSAFQIQTVPSLVSRIYDGDIQLKMLPHLEGRDQHGIERYVAYANECFIQLLTPIFACFIVIALLYAKPSFKICQACLLCAGLMLRLCVALKDPRLLQNWPLGDDPHYYYGIARNLVEGNGLCFDSFNVTNGFQPLLLLLILPVFKFVQDPLAAINACLVLQSLIATGGAVLLCALVRRWTSPFAALLVLGMWAFSKHFIAVDVNGLETGLAFFLMVSVLLAFQCWFVGAEKLSLRRSCLLGGLIGLCVLARIDCGILAVSIMFSYLYLSFKRKTPLRTVLIRSSAIVLAAVLVASPWFILNLNISDSLLPTSGQAVRLLSYSFGYIFFTNATNVGPVDVQAGEIPWSFIAHNLKAAWISILRITDAVLGHKAFLVLCGFSVFLSCKLWLGSVKRWWPILLYFVLLFLAYSTYIFGPWFYDRYMTPVLLGYVLLFASSITSLRQWVQGRPHSLQVFCNVALAGLMALYVFQQTRSLLDQRRSDVSFAAYDAAVWINQNTPADATIGTFQGGIFGYYLERPFYALDGKVSRPAWIAMSEKRMDKFIEEKGIDYLADDSFIFRPLLDLRSKNRHFRKAMDLVYEEEHERSGRYLVYRVQP